MTPSLALSAQIDAPIRIIPGNWADMPDPVLGFQLRRCGTAIHYFFKLSLRFQGENYLGNIFPFSFLSFLFSSSSNGIQFDSETGEIRVSSEKLMEGIAVSMRTITAEGVVTGQFDLNIALQDREEQSPAAPTARGALEDVVISFGDAPVTVNAAADFTGANLIFKVNRSGATIDSTTGVVTIRTDEFLSEEPVTVTASNSSGSATSTFRVTVLPVIPEMTAVPTLSGDGTVGSPLSVTTGTWSGAPAPDLALQWLRDGTEVAGATGSDYTPGAEDNLKKVSCRVTASNVGGSAAAETDTLRIAYAAPELIGTLRDVSAKKGTPELLIDAAQVFTGEALGFSVKGANARIDAATGVIRIPTDTVLGPTKVTVTAENSGGTAETAFQVEITTSNALPILLGAPALVGDAKIGQALTLDKGLWGGTPSPDLAIQWLRDGTAIDKAITDTYTPVPADDLKKISCRVTAANVVGSIEGVTDALVVTYVAPTAEGVLPEEVFDQFTGLQEIETASVFKGENLTFAVEGAGATIDPATGVVSVPTETAFEGEFVTVSARNSGGTALSDFMVTVEAVAIGKPEPLADAAWEIAGSTWSPAGQTTTFQPRIRIDKSVSVHAAQWTTSGSEPAREEHWETLASTVDVNEFVPEMLNQGTGDWHLFQEGKSRNAAFRIRYKTSEKGEWSNESGKKEILPPASVKPPAEIKSWTVAPGKADGEIALSIAAGQPSSWGSDGKGVIQWHNALDGWQTVPSLTFTHTLDKSLYGTDAKIGVRAIGANGTQGPATEATVKVPGKVPVSEDIWKPALLVGEDALGKGLSGGFREGKGGEHYQFFHGGDVHRLFPDDYITIMDVHHIWYTRNARDEFPTYHVPEGRGITSRYGITCKFDPEIPGRWIAVCASRGAGSNNIGGLFLTEDHGQSYTYKETNLYVVGGQAQSNTQFRAWSRTLIWNNQNFNEWLFVNRWYGGQGGETMKSTDRGRSWSVANTYFKSSQISRIYTVAQDAKGKVWVGSENGIHASTNFGGSWSNGVRPSGLPTGWVVGIECHPTDANIGYVAVYDKGVYRTTDGFKTVQQISPGASSYCNVFASPYDFNKVWIMSLHKDPSKGSDTGVRPQFSANGLAASPGNIKWDSLGSLETKTYGWPQGVGDSNPALTGGSNNLMQGGINPLNVPGNPNAAIGHFKARHFSTRNGSLFINAADGVEHAGAGDVNADGIAFHPTDPNIACVCAFDKGGLITRNGWKSFYRMGHGAGGAPASIAGSGTGGFSPDNKNDFVITTGDYNSYSARITRNATSDSPSWTTINQILNDTTGGDPWCRFLKYCPVPGNGNIIYSDHFRSENNGSNWIDLRTRSGWPSGGYDAHVFWCSYTDPRVLYALNGNMDTVYRSDTKGDSWYKYVDLGGSVSIAQGYNKEVAIDVSPLDHNKILWWNRGIGLREYDGNKTRIMLAAARNQDQVWRVKYSHNYPGVFYVQCQLTGEATIWRTTDNGASFIEIDKHLPKSGAIRSMVVCPHTDILYTIGTIGTRYFPPPTLNGLAKQRLQNYKDWWNYDRTWITATYGY